MSTALFPLGQTVITRSAADAVDPQDVELCLGRHALGDWGDLDSDDVRSNQVGLEQNLRLFSVYNDRAGVRFWVITESYRSVTTVLLPEDY